MFRGPVLIKPKQRVFFACCSKRNGQLCMIDHKKCLFRENQKKLKNAKYRDVEEKEDFSGHAAMSELDFF